MTPGTVIQRRKFLIEEREKYEREHAVSISIEDEIESSLLTFCNSNTNNCFSLAFSVTRKRLRIHAVMVFPGSPSFVSSGSAYVLRQQGPDIRLWTEWKLSGCMTVTEHT